MPSNCNGEILSTTIPRDRKELFMLSDVAAAAIFCMSPLGTVTSVSTLMVVARSRRVEATSVTRPIVTLSTETERACAIPVTYSTRFVSNSASDIESVVVNITVDIVCVGVLSRAAGEFVIVAVGVVVVLEGGAVVVLVCIVEEAVVVATDIVVVLSRAVGEFVVVAAGVVVVLVGVSVVLEGVVVEVVVVVVGVVVVLEGGGVVDEVLVVAVGVVVVL